MIKNCLVLKYARCLVNKWSILVALVLTAVGNLQTLLPPAIQFPTEMTWGALLIGIFVAQYVVWREHEKWFLEYEIKPIQKEDNAGRKTLHCVRCSDGGLDSLLIDTEDKQVVCPTCGKIYSKPSGFFSPRY